MAKLRFALIGAGIMGRNHLRVLAEMPQVEVVAVCDPNAPENLPYRVYDNLDTLLASEKLDAAIIAVPTYLHKETALKCIDAGVALLIEKPVAHSIDAGEAIAAAAESKGVKTVIGHIERFNPVVQALKQEIAKQEIFSIHITRVGPIPPRITDVGILTDLAVHDIDLIRVISGAEIRAQTINKSRKIHGNHEDNASLAFKLDRDIVASITTNWLTPFKKRTIEVATRDAYYEANLISQELTEYSAFKLNNSFVTRVCFVRKGEPLSRELEAFVKYVQNGEVSLLASVHDSLRTLQVLAGG